MKRKRKDYKSKMKRVNTLPDSDLTDFTRELDRDREDAKN